MSMPRRAAQRGARILTVAAGDAARAFLRNSLGIEGYNVYEAATAEEVRKKIGLARPDLILWDLDLPGKGGLDWSCSLREWPAIPVIVLSAHGGISEKIAALDAGADDYITKPFAPGELFARMRTVLRRAGGPEAARKFQAAGIQVDFTRRTVTLNGARVQLTPTEWDLLKTLTRHAGAAVAHRQLIREVWAGICSQEPMHLLRVNISNLRRKLEADPGRPAWILTEPGVGYRLEMGKEAAEAAWSAAVSL